jgi:hypothetical protein
MPLRYATHVRAVVVWLAAASCGRIDFDMRSDATRGDGDAGTGPPCNAVTRFADDFADGLRDPRWGASFMGTGTITAEVGGELVMTLATNSAGAYAGYNTIRYYDLHRVRMSVAVTQVRTRPPPSGSGDVRHERRHGDRRRFRRAVNLSRHRAISAARAADRRHATQDASFYCTIDTDCDQAAGETCDLGDRCDVSRVHRPDRVQYERRLSRVPDVHRRAGWNVRRLAAGCTHI